MVRDVDGAKFMFYIEESVTFTGRSGSVGTG